ncbi:hypothetical protein [Microcoleus vaginatus]|uniref:hypothetical protein n=1 Tax=Microcoleus vaginatus TaxID=119532 RepID=UPI0016828FFA|nr:hypothetical protein [Microcoleus sp. FACHB-84]MBD2011833.1 hypothetical protein [Microcoleus sp. FACHB-45]
MGFPDYLPLWNLANTLLKLAIEKTRNHTTTPAPMLIKSSISGWVYNGEVTTRWRN